MYKILDLQLSMIGDGLEEMVGCQYVHTAGLCSVHISVNHLNDLLAHSSPLNDSHLCTIVLKDQY